MENTLPLPEYCKKLENKVFQLRKRMMLAQSRNYELRYAGQGEPSQLELKARIEWLESEVKRLAIERGQNK